MLFREIVTVYSENHMKPIIAMWAKWIVLSCNHCDLRVENIILSPITPENFTNFVGFEVLTAVAMKSSIF
jgi:hypothetical protein